MVISEELYGQKQFAITTLRKLKVKSLKLKVVEGWSENYFNMVFRPYHHSFKLSDLSFKLIKVHQWCRKEVKNLWL